MVKKVKQYQKNIQDFVGAETLFINEDKLRLEVNESRDAVLELISKIDKKGGKLNIDDLDLLAALLQIIALRMERFDLVFDSNRQGL